MPRLKNGTALEVLRQQQIELAKRIAKEEAAHRERERQDHQRRCYLAGDAALAAMQADPRSAFAETLLGLINRRVRGAADRALFQLPPIAKETEMAAAGHINGGGQNGHTAD